MLTPLVSAMPAFAAAPDWDTTGSYVANFNYLGTDYAHDISLTQDGLGNLTGNGGSPAGANTYMWTITPSGTVSANTIDFYADYTATPDAVTPQTTMHVMGTIAIDGTMSGTWSDNYQGGERAGTWMTTSGNAEEIPDSEPDPTITVTVVKYIDGEMATATSGQNMSFPMNSTWDAENIGSGSGNYNLGPSGFNSPTPYNAVTSEMTKGADYTTNELTNGETVGANCPTEGEGVPYALQGYTSGNHLHQAENDTPTLTPPDLTNIHHDKFIIVWNVTCDGGSTDDGDIDGDVNPENGVLKVDSITVVKSDSTADGTWEGGWKYVFHITDPNNEPKIAMKFADWISGTNTIPVANNMRISSLQADNGGVPIVLTAANTYSTPPLNMVTDLNAGMAGRQVDVTVEVKIPVGTAAGSYSTTYGVQSTP